MQATNLTSRVRRRTGISLIVLSGLVLLGSSVPKFAHVPAVVEAMGRLGLGGDKLLVVAGLEVLSAALFLIPVTRSLGLLMVSAFLGGAIATHLQHGESPLGPAVVQALVWSGTWLRHPHVAWSLVRARGSGGPRERPERTSMPVEARQE